MTKWYYNPAWYALAISLVSLVVAGLALRASHRTSRAAVERSLIDRRAVINEAFLKYDVVGPYASHLRVPPERAKPFTAMGVLLFHQINLLHEVYVNRDILGDVTVAGYENWARKILRPWIEQDDDLRRIWKTVRESKDMLGTDFVQWLEQRIEIVDRPAVQQGSTK